MPKLSPSVDVFYASPDLKTAGVRSLTDEFTLRVKDIGRFERTVHKLLSGMPLNRSEQKLAELLKKLGVVREERDVAWEGDKKVRVNARISGFRRERETLEKRIIKGGKRVSILISSSAFTDEIEEWDRKTSPPKLVALTDSFIGPFTLREGDATASDAIKRIKSSWKLKPVRFVAVKMKERVPPANALFFKTILDELERFSKSEQVRLKNRILLPGGKPERIIPYGKSTVGEKKDLHIKSRKVVYRENGHRCANALDTIKKAEKLVGKFGIITSLRGGKCETSEVMDPKLLGKISWRSALNMRIHGGKGVSRDQKIASCLLEGIERYCGKYRGDEKLTVARYEDVRKDAIPPAEFVPSRLQMENWEGREIEWVWGYSLTRKKPVLVPAVFTFLAFKSRASRFVNYDSNGLAAGNTLEEAILHGICEVVERDSALIVMKNRMRVPEIDYPLSPKLVKLLNGAECRVFNFTLDIPVPVLGTMVGETLAVGAHLDPDVALTRAVTEALQIFPQKSPVDFLKSGKKGTFNLKNLASDDLKESIETCVRLLKKAGLETIVVDLSRPDVPFPVVRVLIPGTQPIDAPGMPRLSKRCIEVPKKLGYRSNPGFDLPPGYLSPLDRVMYPY